MAKVYKPTIKKFLSYDVRVININGKEYMILKDMFNCLDRLSAEGQIVNNDRKKMANYLSSKGMRPMFKIRIKLAENKSSQECHVYDFKFINDNWNEIELLFNKKGYNCISTREEVSFVGKVKDFFKYDKYIFIEEQFPILEYRIDLVIGDSVFIEYDEKHHSWQKGDDIERMQRISLANTANIYWEDKQIHLSYTNDYKKQMYTYEEYEGFETYDFNGVFFIRIHDTNVMNWIPLVYTYYNDYMDGMCKKPKTLIKHSSELKNYKYTC